jgi:very-short-patch-repair endonuclease
MIKQKLERARQDLIDKGLRHNPLLNFKLSKAKGVAVVDGDSATVYASLVVDEKGLVFASNTYRGTKNVLHTDYDDDTLQKRLLKTHSDARTYIEERGVNVLYLALGMLHWYEEASSSTELRAPLLLVPVKMERSSASDAFVVRYSNEDIEENISLAARMTELGLKLPAIEDKDEIDVDAYFDQVERAIKTQRRWRVERSEIALSLFSFSNIFMFRDLVPENWCTETSPNGSPIIESLLGSGFGADVPSISEDEYLDKHIAPDVLRQVVDADSSQALAMLDVKRGMNLVIQGPPGTGKSQTITNIIADAVADGKKVLFVAEKSAALDVVKRRLSKVGLGDLCLELHSHTANKKALLEELRRTHQLGRPVASKGWSLQNYKANRDALNEYCLSLNTDIEGTSWTPHQLIGKLAGVRARNIHQSIPDAELPASDVLWTKSQYQHKQNIVAEAARLLTEIKAPSSNPFRYTQLEVLMPFEQDAVLKLLMQALDTYKDLSGKLHEFAAGTGCIADGTVYEITSMMLAAHRASSAPTCNGIDSSHKAWEERGAELLELVKKGRYCSDLRQQYASILHEHSWETDCSVMHRVLEEKGSSLLRWFSSDYRKARSSSKALIANGQKYDVSGTKQILEAVIAFQQGKRDIENAPSGLRLLLGQHWKGMQTSWSSAEEITAWVIDFVSSPQTTPYDADMLKYLAASSANASGLRVYEGEITRKLVALNEQVQSIVSKLAYDAGAQHMLLSGSVSQMSSVLGSMIDNIGLLQHAVRWNGMKRALESEGMMWMSGMIEQRNLAPDDLEDVFIFNALNPLLRKAFTERPSLARADGSSMTSKREVFKELDQASFLSTRDELLAKHHMGIPKTTDQGQVGILAREYQKKRRHMPIRKLMEQTHDVIQAMKPVFMMSPKSIAAFLATNSVSFDLVVFDEASQIRPVDAFGALLRGKQIVVVGDTKQLPPTNFFARMLDDEADDDSSDSVTSDIESLLGLAASQGVPQRMLRWHYRSRHDSLIALSNQLFYDNRLIVFPSPIAVRSDLGLVFHHLPDSVYDRGKSRTNAAEADAVAMAVIEHARNNPGKTLGVATFNTQQAEAINSRLELLRRQHPDTENFFQAHQDEPFFCKSLESVQGDERDVIFISIGYGRDHAGYLSMSFGAVNKDGGERRLNVLITRARESCHVFSNITHHDINDSRSSSSGLMALKAFLRYAERGEIDIPTSGTEDVESPFEEEVANALKARGYQVAYQVGSGGFRIDLAIRDTENPSNYIIGIECDGATYHRSRSARDRDRLRQQALENIGWRLHRIWSTDWFRSPDEEMKKLIASVNEATVHARARSTQQRSVSIVSASTLPVSASANALERQPKRTDVSKEIVGIPYKYARLQIRLGSRQLHEVSPQEMAKWIVSVVDVESPILVSNVIARIANAAGVKRVASRIEETYNDGLKLAIQSGSVTKTKEFLYSSSNTQIHVRDRADFDPSDKRTDAIAPEEIDAAIELVIRETFGIAAADLSTAVGKALGFKRTSEDMQSYVRQRLKSIQKAGRVEDKAGLLRIVSETT